MKLKFEKFSSDINKEITPYLSVKSLGRLASTSNQNYGFFQNSVKCSKFLLKVAYGHHTAVREELSMNSFPTICLRGNLVDHVGRSFINISAFEYALWALDKNMWELLTDFACNPENKPIFATLLSQYNKVQNDGVTYTMNGTLITEKHFETANLIAEAFLNIQELDFKPWTENLHAARMQLPLHLINENHADKPKSRFTVQNKEVCGDIIIVNCMLDIKTLHQQTAEDSIKLGMHLKKQEETCDDFEVYNAPPN